MMKDAMGWDHQIDLHTYTHTHSHTLTHKTHPFSFFFLIVTLCSLPFLSLPLASFFSSFPGSFWSLDIDPTAGPVHWHSLASLVSSWLAVNEIALASWCSMNGDVISYVNISNIGQEDAGVYKCDVKNEIGSVGHSEEIFVTGPPFIKPLGNITVLSGDTLTIRCPVTGYPISSIYWMKGKTITSPLPPSHPPFIGIHQSAFGLNCTLHTHTYTQADTHSFPLSWFGPGNCICLSMLFPPLHLLFCLLSTLPCTLWFVLFTLCLFFSLTLQVTWTARMNSLCAKSHIFFFPCLTHTACYSSLSLSFYV